ncbi:FAD-dependent monooxygenase [Caulobacter sp. S45]|uniref:FAD-dependent monooxygenase n=1 Tax=Caulobacter sp. S45 TaxID=1641861 RepID=UPI0020C5BFEB|nr:FAD-dependent monooxygenase [Caulobacter sp. S45]
MTLTHDVLIAGAGPVGPLLACELRLAGASMLVLEKADDPHSPLKRLPFGLRGLTMPNIEVLDRHGLLDAIAAPSAAAGAAAHWANQPRRPGGHFAGIQFHLDKVDRSAWPERPPGLPSPPLAVELERVELERVELALGARAEALDAEIRRGVAVEDVEQAEDGVTVLAGDARYDAAWLVGCDGGRSVVRRAAGFTFTGTEPEFTGYSVEVELADPALLRAGRHHGPAGMYTFAPPGVIAMVEFDRGAAHRVEPITAENVGAMLRRVSGVDVVVTALRQATTWTDRAFQAGVYRRGRVLLAGDAAHIHSPLGGQGLNLGLGDAADLGWKLAATVRGDAPANLLDTYERERRPVGAAVLDWSRAQVALMRPDPGSRALATIIRDLIQTSDGASYVAGRVWRMGPA